MWDNLAVQFRSKLWLSFQIPRYVIGLVQPFSTAKAVRDISFILLRIGEYACLGRDSVSW